MFLVCSYLLVHLSPNVLIKNVPIKKERITTFYKDHDDRINPNAGKLSESFGQQNRKSYYLGKEIK